ncbi:uncharacterized protein EDB91DRAFT_1247464 [Suillus paluster]|uniref:uncharacterized protein n=1 Tax=Suillus paluster TaxID=48578 RepID=UPI001B878FC6|nr:uncharacterized protein EDB91DRAFT_1247464 [Suillus paluster]KAG1742649.1 hypothetical protein EDB91DRAFT_1247464 [Suillus paluster]
MLSPANIHKCTSPQLHLEFGTQTGGKHAIRPCPRSTFHTLLSSPIRFTLSGKQRFVALYAIVNSGALESFKDDIIHIPLPPSLTLHTIYPLIYSPLTLLVGATTKRNLAGTKPKRRLWTEAGIALLTEQE